MSQLPAEVYEALYALHLVIEGIRELPEITENAKSALDAMDLRDSPLWDQLTKVGVASEKYLNLTSALGAQES